MYKFILIAITSLIAFPQLNQSFARKAPEKIFTIEDCIDIAKRNNPDILINEPQIRSAQANLNNAFGNYLPNVNFNGGFNSSNFQIPVGVNPDGSRQFQFIQNSTYNIGVNANLTIFDGFNREANYQSAENNFNSIKMQAKQTFNDILLNIYLNFIDVVRKQKIVTVSEENLIAGNAQLKEIKARFAAGSLPEADVFQQEAEVARRELTVITTQNDIDLAKANLLTAMGVDPTLSISLNEQSLDTILTQSEIDAFRNKIGNYRSVVDASKNTRPDYKASNYQVDQSMNVITQARANYWPRVSANAGWRFDNTELNDFSENGRLNFGVNLQLPIFNGFSINNQVQRSQLQYEQAKLRQTKLEQSIKSGIQSAFLNLETSEKSFVISKKAQRAAKLSYDSQNKRYELGAATLNDVIIANSNFISANIDLINSIYSYYLAQKQLEYQIGIIK